MADTLSRNQLIQATVKLLYFKPLNSGHLYIADTFSENQWCPLLRDFTVFTLHFCCIRELFTISAFVRYSNMDGIIRKEGNLTTDRVYLN